MAAEPRFVCYLLLAASLLGPAAVQSRRLGTLLKYINFTLANEHICNPIKNDPEVLLNLRKNTDSAILLEPGSVFKSWVVKYDKHCKFKIKGPKGDGLFAVIQRMSLRRHGYECLDYVKFSTEKHESEKYCGKLDNYAGANFYNPFLRNSDSEVQESNNQNAENNITGKFGEFNPNGKITTEIFISKKPLLEGEMLDLIIAYTPYKSCKSIDNEMKYWSSLLHPEICIDNDYVCDGYANCPSTICLDESNCTNEVNKIISDGVGTKVTISAVTTMFLCFIIFVLCLWICRKHEKLCWSPDCAGPSNISGSVSGLPMDRGDQNVPSRPYVPTAPMLEVAVPTSVHDKDLPPSYDSLFPSQTNSTST